jgi:hypothetical protein
MTAKSAIFFTYCCFILVMLAVRKYFQSELGDLMI